MIRDAKQNDVPSMVHIYSKYVLETCFTFEYEVPSEAEFSERLEQVQQQYPWLVCELEGKVVGYAYASQVFKRAAYQWNTELSIYIDEVHQHKGIATALYYCLEEILLQQGYYNLYAVITSENDKSIELVKKFGFRQAGHYENAGFKLGNWHDVHWLVKPIRQTSASIPKFPVAYRHLDAKLVNSVLDRWQVK